MITDLDSRFTFHPATPTTGPLHDEIRLAARTFAETIIRCTAVTREQSLAITATEEAMFWANAAIARHGG